MNKQFLSLLLLTSFGFTGTTSPVITSGKDLSSALINYFKPATVLAAAESARLAARPFYTKAWEGTCGYASSAKTSVANGAQAVVASVKSHPYIATGVGVAASCGLVYLAYNKRKTIKTSASNGVAAVKRNPIKSAAVGVGAAAVGVVAKYYPQSAINGFNVISGYTSSAKTSVANYVVTPVSNGIQAVFASVKSHPYIATGIVATCGLSYLGYKFLNRDSMSLTEQEKDKLKTALAKAKARTFTGNMCSTVMPDQLVLIEHFTTKESGFSSIIVEKLNKFVTLNNHYKVMEALFSSSPGNLSHPETFAAFNATKSLRDITLDELTLATKASVTK